MNERHNEIIINETALIGQKERERNGALLYFASLT